MKHLSLLFSGICCLLLLVGCELVTSEPKRDVYYIGVAETYSMDNCLLEDETIYAPELDMCDEDAVLVKETFSSRGYDSFTSVGSNDTDREIICDSDGSAKVAEAMEKALAEAAALADDDDLTIFFYSGHGLNASYPLVLSTGTQGSEGEQLYSLYGAKTLMKKLEQIPGDKLVLIDSCFSGGFVDAAEPSGSALDKLFSDKAHGIYALTSSTGSQKSYSSVQYGLGWFTYYLCAELDAHKDIALSALHDLVRYHTDAYQTATTNSSVPADLML